MSVPSATTPQPLPGPASFRVSGDSHSKDAGPRSVRLKAHDLRIGYRVGGSRAERGERVLADGLDLDLRSGELVCLLGPNGAGKSTLLRTLAGLQDPLAGYVEIDGRAYEDWRPRELARRLAVVLTDRTLPAMMTGLDLVRLGRHPHTPWTGTLSDADRDAVQSALEAVDALHLAPRPLAEMSDGERQKVTIARALAQEAEVLVLDEVTAFLDLPRRVEIVRLLRRLAHGSSNKAIVLATHDLDLALRSADRLWLLSQPPDSDTSGVARQGLLTQGAPESLVLDGSFERVFASEGVEFDRRSGSFQLHRRRRGSAWVDGDGLAALWTRRALDRLGFEIDVDAPLRVEVEETPSGASWKVSQPTPDDDAASAQTVSAQTASAHATLDEALAAVLAAVTAGSS